MIWKKMIDMDFTFKDVKQNFTPPQRVPTSIDLHSGLLVLA